MRQRGYVIGSVLAVVLLGLVYFVNGSSLNSNQMFSEEESAWLDSHADLRVYYHSSDVDQRLLDGVIYYMEKITGLEMQAATDGMSDELTVHFFSDESYAGDRGQRMMMKLVRSKPLYVEVDQSDELLGSVLLTTLKKFRDGGSFAELQESLIQEDRIAAYKASLSAEEAGYLLSREAINVGVEIMEPWIYEEDGVLHGVVIGYMEHLETLTGVEVNYILGEREKLIASVKDYNLQLLWLDKPVESERLGLIKTHYVAVGTSGQQPLMHDAELAMFAIGVGSNESIRGYLRQLSIAMEIIDYGSYENLMNSFFEGEMELAVIPMPVYLHYESELIKKGYEIRYRLSEACVLGPVLTSEDLLLEGIINKSMPFTDHPRIISDSSLANDDDGSQTGTYWSLVTAIIIGGALFLSLFIVKMYINHSQKKQMNYLFQHDYLTNLPNRAGIKQEVDRVLAQMSGGMLFMIDINGMKKINDNLGHRYGDQVILEFAHVLAEVKEESSLLGHPGGNTFILLVEGSSEDEGSGLVERVREAAADYGKDKEELYEFSVTLSSVSLLEEADDFDMLYGYLEHTMIMAKKEASRNGYEHFSRAIHDRWMTEEALAGDILRGILEDQFVLYIQPQVSLPKEVLVGGELLLRWQHPTEGLMTPGSFLGIAEKYGLMRELDYYVMEKASRLIKGWQALYGLMKVSVNLSAATFSDPQLIERLAAITENAGLERSWMIIEVTEDMGMENMSLAKEVFAALGNNGFKIAIDDFGKGYSSLSYIQQLPFDILKIDKAFVDHVHIDEQSRKIFDAIVGIAEVMNLDVVAEGVEYPEQKEVINAYEGIVVQGYYYSKPIPVQEFGDYRRSLQA